MDKSILIVSQYVQENSQHVAKVVGRSLEKHSVSFLQGFKNGVSNSYFVKIIEKQEKGVYIGCNMYIREFVLERFSKKF